MKTRFCYTSFHVIFSYDLDGIVMLLVLLILRCWCYDSQVISSPLFDFSPKTKGDEVSNSKLVESWTQLETRKRCNSGSLDPTKSRYSPFILSSKQCSVTIRSAEHRIQGGVKFGQLKGPSSRYSFGLPTRTSSVWGGQLQFEADIISLGRTSPHWADISSWSGHHSGCTARGTSSSSCVHNICGERHMSSYSHQTGDATSI